MDLARKIRDEYPRCFTKPSTGTGISMKDVSKKLGPALKKFVNVLVNPYSYVFEVDKFLQA